MGSQASKAAESRHVLQAARHDRLEVVGRWLKAQPLLVCSARSHAGSTVWHVAARKAESDLLKLLVHCARTAKLSTTQLQLLGAHVSADHSELTNPAASDLLLKQLVNQTNGKGETPLMLACGQGNVENVELLLSLGADRWATDKRQGNTCLHYAARKAHLSCISKLFETPLPVSTSIPPGPASRTGSFIDMRNRAGFSALHYATWSDCIEIVRAVLLYGPDLSTCNVINSKSDWIPCKRGCTALHLAVMRDNIDVVRELVKYIVEDPRVSAHDAIDPRTLCNMHGVLPYDMAITHGRWQMAALLVPGRTMQDLFDIIADSSLHGGVNRAEIGPPKLSTLAAAALQRKLLNTIQFAEYELEACVDSSVGSRAVHLKDVKTAERLGLREKGGTRRGMRTKAGSFDDLSAALGATEEQELKGEALALGRGCKRVMPDVNPSFSSKDGSKQGSFSKQGGSFSKQGGSFSKQGGSFSGRTGTSSSDPPPSSSSHAPPSSTPNWWYDKTHHGGCSYGGEEGRGGMGVQGSPAYSGAMNGRAAREYLTGLEGAFDDDLLGGRDGGDDEDEGCGICFNHHHQVASEACGHQLCATCAKEICLKHKYTAAPCPFCRQIIPGFIVNRELLTRSKKQAPSKGKEAAATTHHSHQLKRSST